MASIRDQHQVVQPPHPRDFKRPALHLGITDGRARSLQQARSRKNVQQWMNVKNSKDALNRRFRLLNLLVLGIAIHLFSGDSSPRAFYFQRDKGSDFVARSLNGDFRWKRPGGQNFLKKSQSPRNTGKSGSSIWRTSHARRGACELSGWRWARERPIAPSAHLTRNCSVDF